MRWIMVSVYDALSQQVVFKGTYDADKYPTIKSAVNQFCREMWVAATEDELAVVEHAELLLKIGLYDVYLDGDILTVEVCACQRAHG